MDLFMIRRPTAWADQAELEKTAETSARIGNEEMPDKVCWIRSYVIKQDDGRLGTAYFYEAVDEDALREHARRLGMPGDDILSIGATVVVRPDPV